MFVAFCLRHNLMCHLRLLPLPELAFWHFFGLKMLCLAFSFVRAKASAVRCTANTMSNLLLDSLCLEIAVEFSVIKDQLRWCKQQFYLQTESWSLTEVASVMVPNWEKRLFETRRVAVAAWWNCLSDPKPQANGHLASGHKYLYLMCREECVGIAVYLGVGAFSNCLPPLRHLRNKKWQSGSLTALFRAASWLCCNYALWPIWKAIPKALLASALRVGENHLTCQS